MSDHDVVVVGSGINSLVCAAMLGKRGLRVAVLERNDRLGGCIRTEELFPGFTHDVLSSWYPLFVGGPAYAELAADLHERGLEFVNTDTPTGVLTPDGRALVLTTDPVENERLFDEDERLFDFDELRELAERLLLDRDFCWGILPCCSSESFVTCSALTRIPPFNTQIPSVRARTRTSSSNPQLSG